MLRKLTHLWFPDPDRIEAWAINTGRQADSDYLIVSLVLSLEQITYVYISYIISGKFVECT